MPTGSLRLSTHTAGDRTRRFCGWPLVCPGCGGGSSGAGFYRRDRACRVADFCAAPGGKAAQLAAAGAEVTAIDRSAERLKRLASNFARLNLHADVVVADIVSLKAPLFDAILVDAPCLATGTIRRHPDIAWIKKPRDIAALTALQSRLLDKAVALVKPGGMIVYCTCSIEPEENEHANCGAAYAASPESSVFRSLPDEVGGLSEILNENGELRTLPSHLQADEPRLSGLDGFFAARLLRRG